MLDFVLPAPLEAHEPPKARDDVRLLVGRPGSVTHHRFGELPDLLRPGDLLVVNTSATLPAAVRLDRLAVHFSTPLPDGSWLVELRRRSGGSTVPFTGGQVGEWFPLPGGATLTLLGHHGDATPGRPTGRLWRARLDTDVLPYLQRHGVPIRYGYVARDWPISAYQTVFGTEPGSAEMPSAGRPFTDRLVTRLISRGILLAPLTLHTGVASPEKDEAPYAERYDVPAATADLVNHVRSNGGRVIAVGTTVVRALETSVLKPNPTPVSNDSGGVRASSGWTSHVVTPEAGVKVVDGLLTGLHEPRSSHLNMLTAIAGTDLLTRCYDEALEHGYLWHEFGDLNLLLPAQARHTSVSR
jgi:S-adenosylmethionine:tRNA-ribosyltransferase-isomerase (queuine synthetase)